MTRAMLLGLLTVVAVPLPAGGAEDFGSWPQVGGAENIRLTPMTDQRVGFRLDYDADSRSSAGSC